VMRLFARARSNDGQVVVFVVAILFVLFGIAALVIDGGRWFQTHRHLQTAADAAALAGVQNLPSDPGGAATTASTYAQNNFTGVTATVSVPPSPLPSSCSGTAPYNCIRVVTSKTVPGTFAKFFAALRGATFGDRNESARATAAVTVPSLFKNVAPVAVKNTVACTVPSCFGTSKTVSFDESAVASSTIGLINLTCHDPSLPACVNNNNVGATDLRDWIINGDPDALPSGQWYGVKTGQNVGPIKQGFDARVGVPLFFPVFDNTSNIGSVWYFHIIGWSAFVIDQVVSWSPSNKQLRGHFVTFTTSDLPAGTPPSGSNDFGVHILSLVE
jgi:Flp pilus assembly protein TadG